MSRVSNIERLPQIVRAEIDRRLTKNGFGDYVALAADLRQRGFNKISKSSLHRYGLQLKRRIQMGRAREELETAGISTEIAAELTGEATLVVVIDRRNGRARLVSSPAPAPEVIAHLKTMVRA